MAMKCLLALLCVLLDFANTQIDRSKIVNPDRIYYNDEGQRYPPLSPSDKYDTMIRGRNAPNFNSIQPSVVPFTDSYGTNLLADNVVGTNILSKIPRGDYDNIQQPINSNFQNPFAPPVQFPFHNIPPNFSPNFYPVPQNFNASPNLNNFAGNVSPQNNNLPHNALPQISYSNNNPNRLNTNLANNAFLQSSDAGNRQNDVRKTPPQRVNTDSIYQPITEGFDGNSANNNFGNNVYLQSSNAGNRQNVRTTQRIPIEPPYQPSTERYDGIIGSTNLGSIRNNATLQSVDPVALSISHFGINVMKMLQAQRGNIVISPFSIATLLALIQQGANGNTQNQISNALELSPKHSLNGFRKFLGTIKDSRSRNILNVANGVFVSTNFNINQEYLAAAVDDFGSEVRPVTFERSAAAVRSINKWVSDRTNHKIENLLTEDAVSSDTQLVLVNAVFFKGLWAVKFRPESTVQRDFHMGNGRTKTASFMRMRRYFKADNDRDINSEILILPFQGESYSLVIILPMELYSVGTAFATLTKEKLIEYQKFTPKEVAVEIPKFNAKSDTDLFQVFQRMGVVDMFSPKADLFGIGNSNGYSPRVSSALHSAMLSIDEQGGVAAASTAFAAIALSNDDPMLTFIANRPFIAVLWDNENSTPLFMAKIEDPVS